MFFDLEWWEFCFIALILFMTFLFTNYVLKKINEARIEERFCRLLQKASASQGTQIQEPGLELVPINLKKLPSVTNPESTISLVFDKEDNILQDFRRKKDSIDQKKNKIRGLADIKEIAERADDRMEKRSITSLNNSRLIQNYENAKTTMLGSIVIKDSVNNCSTSQNTGRTLAEISQRNQQSFSPKNSNNSLKSIGHEIKALKTSDADLQISEIFQNEEILTRNNSENSLKYFDTKSIELINTKLQNSEISVKTKESENKLDIKELAQKIETALSRIKNDKLDHSPDKSAPRLLIPETSRKPEATRSPIKNNNSAKTSKLESLPGTPILEFVNLIISQRLEAALNQMESDDSSKRNKRESALETAHEHITTKISQTTDAEFSRMEGDSSSKRHLLEPIPGTAALTYNTYQKPEASSQMGNNNSSQRNILEPKPEALFFEHIKITQEPEAKLSQIESQEPTSKSHSLEPVSRRPDFKHLTTKISRGAEAAFSRTEIDNSKGHILESTPETPALEGVNTKISQKPEYATSKIPSDHSSQTNILDPYLEHIKTKISQRPVAISQNIVPTTSQILHETKNNLHQKINDNASTANKLDTKEVNAVDHCLTIPASSQITEETLPNKLSNSGFRIKKIITEAPLAENGQAKDSKKDNSSKTIELVSLDVSRNVKYKSLLNNTNVLVSEKKPEAANLTSIPIKVLCNSSTNTEISREISTIAVKSKEILTSSDSSSEGNISQPKPSKSQDSFIVRDVMVTITSTLSDPQASQISQATNKSLTSTISDTSGRKYNQKLKNFWEIFLSKSPS